MLHLFCSLYLLRPRTLHLLTKYTFSYYDMVQNVPGGQGRYKGNKRGERDSNPRDVNVNGLAVHRLTGLGHLRIDLINQITFSRHSKINLFYPENPVKSLILGKGPDLFHGRVPFFCHFLCFELAVLGDRDVKTYPLRTGELPEPEFCILRVY